jgi:hypothetical protein
MMNTSIYWAREWRDKGRETERESESVSPDGEIFRSLCVSAGNSVETLFALFYTIVCFFVCIVFLVAPSSFADDLTFNIALLVQRNGMKLNSSLARFFFRIKFGGKG